MSKRAQHINTFIKTAFQRINSNLTTLLMGDGYRLSENGGMKMIVRVLTDDLGVGFCMELHFDMAGRRVHVTHTVKHFMENVVCGEKYVLLVDYLLYGHTSESFLSTLLSCGVTPSAVIVMSGYPNFEEKYDILAEHYANNGIPFHFIQKPFISERLDDILLMIESALLHGMVRKKPNTEFAMLREGNIYIPQNRVTPIRARPCEIKE